MAELAQALVLLLLGGMLFFPIVVAPVVFVALPAAEAGTFLRAMFPRYYLFMIALQPAISSVGSKSTPTTFSLPTREFTF